MMEKTDLNLHFLSDRAIIELLNKLNIMFFNIWNYRSKSKQGNVHSIGE